MVNKFPLFLRIQEIFTSLTKHVALTFKVSTFQFIPLSLEDGGGGGGNTLQDKKHQRQLFIPSYSFYFALQSLPEINGDT